MVTNSLQTKFKKSVTNSSACLMVTSPPKQQQKHIIKALATSNNTKFLTLNQCLIKNSALFMYHTTKILSQKRICNIFFAAKNKNVVTRSNSKTRWEFASKPSEQLTRS